MNMFEILYNNKYSIIESLNCIGYSVKKYEKYITVYKSSDRIMGLTYYDDGDYLTISEVYDNLHDNMEKVYFRKHNISQILQ